MPRESVARRLLVALERRDEIRLAALLHPSVHLVVDSGDRTGGEARGRARVVRELRERLTSRADASLEVADVNGEPGLALRHVDGDIVGVLGLALERVADSGTQTGASAARAASGRGAGGHVAAGRVTAIWLSTAPAKLAHWNRRPPTP